ncbi:hypothetical protein BC938DRAFT_479251 [Jimgerdemannia flammicorona]|uniref:Four-helix bundle copper-binding protein n=1 Tax=Jimgerdemannia flammicorona TaxID=994334 RepID=A0A433QXX3_9FUNG|nr:hypothetical protein BC938DRAFT_479251 [Jimgerdemannia flammicorona]
MSTQVEDYAKYIKACVSTMADCLHCAEKSSREGLDCTQHCRVNAELCDTTARIMALQNMDVLAKVTPITIETAEKCAEMWYDARFAFADRWCRVSFFVLCTSNPYPNYGPPSLHSLTRIPQ